MKQDRLKKEWDEIPKGILPDGIKSRMWMNIRNATISKRKQIYQWAAAASVILFFSIVAGSQFLFEFNSPKAEIIATSTFHDDIRLLRLPDGTRVWVNQNTEIQYPDQFEGNERTVVLKGEAFFEVAKDASKPFIITSGEIKTTVVGTSFNVKAYEGIAPEVHVRTGKVKVEGEQNAVFLERGYAAVFAPSSKTVQKQKTAVSEPEWKKVLIDVDGLTLEQIIEKLQPVHSFSVEYANEDLKGLMIKGTLDTRQGFYEILQTVAFALEVEIKPTARKDHYIISK